MRYRKLPILEKKNRTQTWPRDASLTSVSSRAPWLISFGVKTKVKKACRTATNKVFQTGAVEAIHCACFILQLIASHRTRADLNWPNRLCLFNGFSCLYDFGKNHREKYLSRSLNRRHIYRRLAAKFQKNFGSDSTILFACLSNQIASFD